MNGAWTGRCEKSASVTRSSPIMPRTSRSSECGRARNWSSTPSSCITSSVEGWTVSPRKSRRKSACFSSTTTETPARARRTPSIIPAGPPPAMQQCVSNVMSAFRLQSGFAPRGLERPLEEAGGVVVLRLQRQRGAELGDRLVDLLLADERQAEEVVRGEVARCQSNRLARVRDGLGEVALLQVLQREVALREAVARIGGDRALKGLQRLVVASERGERVAHVRPRIRVARVVAQVQLQLVGGFRVPAEREQLQAEQVANLRQVLDGFAEVRDLLVRPVGELQLRGQIAMRARVRRPAIEHGLPQRQPRTVFRVALISGDGEQQGDWRHDDQRRESAP